MQGSQNSGEDFARLRELIEDIRIAMMTTQDADGTLRSRPIQTLRCADDGMLWFFTSASSPKVAEAQAGGWQVNLSYANPGKQDYVSISGRASLSRDRALMEALWNNWVEVFFPKGLDDPDLALLRVDIEKAEYWDSPGTAVGRAYAIAKARLTGDKDAIGDNVKIDT
ncbi:MAG TPA: pyridoxamine 5'-phosphate oxidase family protein [Burkholderiales bacterium]|nr:pyridoxamine 5'-phosphate oxidase family protein [Burkholderiales bacterium]